MEIATSGALKFLFTRKAANMAYRAVQCAREEGERFTFEGNVIERVDENISARKTTGVEDLNIRPNKNASCIHSN